ncbi:hypothetical protein GRS48_04410 [Halorubrum sp. JWXQ-INN 858]|uniref:hypothetical protein n=1 Tax=Halorubrum sp. JWXQ-INN 858 TaxID=2690782 RepID=UPI0013F9E92A|nr:hypothetical protein [Halorubrum sp. JWXQ-INN 858]MWV64069.1 hypothetical protein [Halorubrum sp. JWXQ-INN 858]
MNARSSVLRFNEVGDWTWVYWLGVALSVAIAAVNLSVGIVASEPALFVVGCSFLLGVGLFFTRLWSPVLYLLGVLHVGVLGVLWVLSGMGFLAVGLLNGGLSLALVAVAMYLFVQEERQATE